MGNAIKFELFDIEIRETTEHYWYNVEIAGQAKIFGVRKDFRHPTVSVIIVDQFDVALDPDTYRHLHAGLQVLIDHTKVRGEPCKVRMEHPFCPGAKVHVNARVVFQDTRYVFVRVAGASNRLERVSAEDLV